MASTTQIVPRYKFPYVETYISDNTEIDENELNETFIEPGVSYIYAFIGERGIDNRWVNKRTQASYVNTFGKPNFKKYGQSNLTPYSLLGEGNANVWCMRCLPVNAKRSHRLVSVWYKADPNADDPTQSKFRIKFTAKAFTGEDDNIITKSDLAKLRETLDGAAPTGTYVDGEGYTQLPGVFMLTCNGRGSSGDQFSIRIATNMDYEKEYGIKMYTFEVLSTTNGLIKEAQFVGSPTTSVKYDSATFINDVLSDTDEGIASVDIDINEDHIETIYDGYIEFAVEQREKLAEYREKLMVENSITSAMLDGTEELGEDPDGVKAKALQKILEIETMYVQAGDENLPELDQFDVVFGLNVASTDTMHPFISFTDKLTDAIDQEAEGFNMNDYTQTDIVSFSDIRGVTLEGGTNGYFDDPRTVTVINKLGEPEQVKWTVEQEYEDALINAWNGTYDKRILTAKRIFANALFDANYPYPVKAVMADLTLARNDSIFYMDIGHRENFGKEELIAIFNQYDVFSNRLISKNAHSFITKDPVTKKRVNVTISHFLALEFWKHFYNNGLYMPFVKNNCQLSGHIRNSMYPTVEDYELTTKELLNNHRINYFETVTDNVYQRATQNTAQMTNSDLLEESNVHLLYEAKRIIEQDISERLYNFNEPEVRNTFRAVEEEKFKDWNSRLVESITISFRANSWELKRSVLHCYVEMVFRGIFKRSIVEIDINPRDFDALASSAE